MGERVSVEDEGWRIGRVVRGFFGKLQEVPGIRDEFPSGYDASADHPSPLALVILLYRRPE